MNFFPVPSPSVAIPCEYQARQEDGYLVSVKFDIRLERLTLKQLKALSEEARASLDAQAAYFTEAARLRAAGDSAAAEKLAEPQQMKNSTQLAKYCKGWVIQSPEGPLLDVPFSPETLETMEDLYPGFEGVCVNALVRMHGTEPAHFGKSVSAAKN